MDDSAVLLEDVDLLNTVDGSHGHLLQNATELLIIFAKKLPFRK